MPDGYTAPSGQTSGSKEPPKTAGQILKYRNNFVEMGLRKVVEAVNGVFIHGIGSAFDQLQGWANDVGDGMQKLGKLITGIDFTQTPDEVWRDIVGVFIKPLNAFADLVGGLINSIHIPILDPTKILNLPGLFSDVQAGWKNAFDKWFGGTSGTGTVAEFTYVIESIKDAVINGFNVVTFTSDTVNWTVPAHAEMTAVMIGGGQNGSAVTTAIGGLHGSFAAMPIDLTGITALDFQVGTAGNRSTIRVHNTTPHTGAIVAQSPVAGAAGGIAGTFGLTPTNSVPGSGGNGGSSGGGATPGTPGDPSGLASGGNGGASGFFGSSGGAGGSVSAGSQVKCGGGGGGGGGGASSAGNTGGNGGAGGYPGGGGGGRGAGFGAASGSNGPGAPGVIWIFYR